MKKGLSLLLAASMAFSAFASAASAAELTAQEKFDALKAEGIFTGFEDGSAGLDQSMTRAQVAAIITRLLDLQENAANAAAYNDLVGAEWAAGYIGAVTPKYMEGDGNGIFRPSGTFTLEELATVMVRVLDLEVEAGATVEGSVSGWAQGYVAAAVKAGIIAESADYTKPAVREALVDSAYEANEVVNAPEVLTAKVNVLGMKKVQVDFNKAVDSATKIEVLRGSSAVSVASTTFADNNKSATLEFTSSLANGTYTVNVEGAEETASFEITEEQVTSIEFLTDRAVLKRDEEDGDDEDRRAFVYVKFTNQYGEDVTKKYYDDADADYRITDVEEDDLVFEDGVVIITLDDDDDKWREGDELSASIYFDNEDGPSVSAKANLVISGASEVADLEITKVVNKTDTDDETIDIDDIYTDWYLLVEASDQYGMKIPVNETGVHILSEDVRGRVDNDDVLDLARDLPFEVIDIDGTDYLGVPFADIAEANREAGEATISLTSRRNNGEASITVKVTDVLRVDRFEMSQPGSAPAGKKISIPFTAYDQFGEVITDRDVLSVYNTRAGDDYNPEGGLEDIDTDGLPYEFKRNASTGKIEFIVDTAGHDKGDTFDIEVETFTQKVVRLRLKLDEAQEVKGIKEVASNFATGYLAGENGGFSFVQLKHLTFVDQFGATMDWENIDWADATPEEGQYRVKITSSNTDVLELDGEAMDATDNRVDSTANEKGTATVEFQLQQYVAGTTNDFVNVKDAKKSVSVRSVEMKDLKSFTATVSAAVYEGDYGVNDDWAEQVVVKGELSNGTTVEIPGYSGLFTVTVQDGLVAEVGTAGKFLNDMTIRTSAFEWDDEKDKSDTTPVTVVVQGDKDNVVIPVEVKVSRETPKSATLALDADVKIANEVDVKGKVLKAEVDDVRANLTLAIAKALKATDQYGKAMDDTTDAAAFYTVIANNFSSDNRKTAGSVIAGDTFTVTVIAKDSGKTVTFDIEVVAENSIK